MAGGQLTKIQILMILLVFEVLSVTMFVGLQVQAFYTNIENTVSGNQSVYGHNIEIPKFNLLTSISGMGEWGYIISSILIILAVIIIIISIQVIYDTLSPARTST